MVTLNGIFLESGIHEKI